MGNRTRSSSILVSLLGLLIIGSTIFSGCQVIGGIFKAGVAVGVIIVIIILALIIGLAMMFRK
jgi:hypothetical protein